MRKKSRTLIQIAIPLALVGLLLAWVAPTVGQDFMRDEPPPVGVDQAEQLTAIALDAIHQGRYKDAIHALHSAAFVLEEGLGFHMPGAGMGRMPFLSGPMLMEHPMEFPREPDPFMRGTEEIRKLLGWLAEEHGIDVGPIIETVEEAIILRHQGSVEDAEYMLEQIKNQVAEIMERHGIAPPPPPPPCHEMEFLEIFVHTRRFMEELMELGADIEGIPGRLEEAERLFDEGRVDEALEILRDVKHDLRLINAEMEE